MSLTRAVKGIFRGKKARRNLDFPLIQTSDTIIEVRWLKQFM